MKNTWLWRIHKHPYYQYSDEEIDEAIAGITSQQRYKELGKENIGVRFRTIKQRAQDTAYHFEGDPVTVSYDPENPAAAVLSASEVPRSYRFLNYKQTVYLFAGICIFLFVAWLTWILGLPGWTVKFIVFAVVIGFLWYKVYGPGKQEETKTAGPDRQYSQSTRVGDQSWQTAEGSIYISFFDTRTNKFRGNTVPISKVVYRYTVNGERYTHTHVADGWDVAETYRENARVEVQYMESDPSVSRLGGVIQ